MSEPRFYIGAPPPRKLSKRRRRAAVVYSEGDRVVFTVDHLGILAHADALRFEDETVDAGDVGNYLGPHPYLEGWHLVRLEDGRVVPAGALQIKPAPGGGTESIEWPGRSSPP